MGDDEVTLAGYDPAIHGDDDAVSKQDDAESDVGDDVARRYARMILRRGDVLTASKAVKAGLPDDTDAIVDDMVDDVLRTDDETDARQIVESIVGFVGEVGTRSTTCGGSSTARVVKPE